MSLNRAVQLFCFTIDWIARKIFLTFSRTSLSNHPVNRTSSIRHCLNPYALYLPPSLEIFFCNRLHNYQISLLLACQNNKINFQ